MPTLVTRKKASQQPAISQIYQELQQRLQQLQAAYTYSRSGFGGWLKSFFFGQSASRAGQLQQLSALASRIELLTEYANRPNLELYHQLQLWHINDEMNTLQQNLAREESNRSWLARLFFSSSLIQEVRKITNYLSSLLQNFPGRKQVQKDCETLLERQAELQPKYTFPKLADEAAVKCKIAHHIVTDVDPVEAASFISARKEDLPIIEIAVARLITIETISTLVIVGEHPQWRDSVTRCEEYGIGDTMKLAEKGAEVKAVAITEENVDMRYLNELMQDRWRYELGNPALLLIDDIWLTPQNIKKLKLFEPELLIFPEFIRDKLNAMVPENTTKKNIHQINDAFELLRYSNVKGTTRITEGHPDTLVDAATIKLSESMAALFRATTSSSGTYSPTFVSSPEGSMNPLKLTATLTSSLS